MLSSLTAGFTYALLNSNSGLAADVPGGTADSDSGAHSFSGELVVQYNWSSRSEQEWKLTSVGSGHYEIVNVGSGLALAVTGESKSSGATVDQETYAGNASQQWTLTSVGSSGAFLITNVNSGLNLDVTSTSAYGGYGAQLIQATASGGASQDWQLEALTSGWTDQDIGSPAGAGSADYTAIYNGTTWTVTGGGTDIYGTSDQFNFASQSFTGNGEIVAEVLSQTDSNASAKAGVMFRNTNAANSAFVDVVVTPSDGVEFQWRNTAGGSSYSASVSGIKASIWVELVRSGNQFSGYYSTNDNTWTQIGSTQTITMNSTLLAGLAVTAHNSSSTSTETSTADFSWVSVEAPPVYVNSSGQLAYNALSDGDQIMDFSTAGYEEGDMPIPTNITVEETVDPSGDTSGSTDMTNIQNAINKVEDMPLVDGFRGAVLLAPGEFYVSGTLNITASGVVLEGSGDSGYSSGGTTIQMTTAVQTLISATGSYSINQVSGTKENVTESYVPSSADTLTVASASPYQVGDQIEVVQTVSAAWIQYMGMDQLWRNGSQETWIGSGSTIITERTITAIDGNQITLDAPMSSSINANLTPGTYVAEYTSSVISQVGVQDMQVLAEGPAQSVAGGGDEVVAFGGLTNGWIQNLDTNNTFNTIEINGNTSKITVQYVTITHSAVVSGDDAPADFAVNGPSTQILFTHLSINGNQDWYFTTGAEATGPIVLMDSTFTGDGSVEPHQRWTTGILIDNVSVPGGGIDNFDRGTDGSGHGWTTGSSVIWNSSADSLLEQNPPGTENWTIGSTGTEETDSQAGGGPVEPPGIVYSQGVPISSIPSLYEAQLARRLAENALPTGWTSQDIGGPETIGSSSYNDNTDVWTVTGDGSDIYGTSDQFQFASESAGSYVTVSAEVDSVQDVNASTKAGVMIRNTNAANSAFADVIVTPSDGVEFQWRSTAGGSSSSVGVSGTAPVWVKLVRSGSSFSAYYSTNGTTWIQIGSAETITMSDVVLAGLAVTSHVSTGTLATGTFSDASVVNEVMNETLSDATISQNEAFFSGSTLTIENGLTIDSGVTVSIEPGAVIDFTGSQTLSGAGDIDLNGGQFEVDPSDTLTIDSGTTISGAGYISGNLNIAGNVTISGLVSDSGNVAIGSGDTLTVNPTANTIFSGIVSGAGNLTVGGGLDSSLTLTGANTYSGATTINSGATLQIGNGGTTGNLGTAPITDNGTLAFDLSSPLTVSNVISGTGGLLDSGTGVITLPVADTYKGLTTINSGSTLDVSGSIVGPVDDNGTLNLENTLGITDLNGSGSINLTSGDTLTVVPTMMDTYSGVISGAAGLTIGGTTGSSLTLNGANTYTGATTINNGATLEVGNGSNSTATLGTGSIIDSGALIFDFSASPASALSNTISGTGSMTFLAGPATFYSLDMSGNLTGYDGTITLNSQSRLQLSSANAVPGASSSIIVNSGGGLFVATTSFNYAGNISISGFGVTGGSDHNGFGAIRLDSSAINLSGTITIDAGGAMLGVESGTVTISGQITGSGQLEIGSSSASNTLILTNAADNWTGGTAIYNGILQLQKPMAANPLGSVTFGNNGAVNDYLGQSGATSGTLDLYGTSQTLTGLAVASGAGTANEITSTASGGNLTFASGTSTFSGLIAGGADLALALASGSLTLTDANTYTDGTTISGGTLEVSDTADNGSSSLGGGNVTVKTGGILIGADQDAFGYGGTAPQTITINGGTVTDLGTSDYRITLPNLIFINGGTLTSATGNTGDAYGNYSFNGEGGTAAVTIDAAASTATISAAQISFEQPTTFDVVGGAGSIGVTSGGVTPDLLVSSNIVPFGSYTFAKTGSGIMKLTGANTNTVTPDPVTGTTTNLSVQGPDIDGQNNGTLIYTWSVTSKPSGATTPTFSANGTDAAANTTATFTQAGSYTFLATITYNTDLSSTSSISVTVNQTFTSIAVSPGNPPSLSWNATEQFSATGYDQFGNAMTTQPAFTWSVTSGGGMVNSSGLYTAPSANTTAMVQAASGAVSNSATVTVANTAPGLIEAASASPNPVTGTSTNLSVEGSDTDGEGNNTLTYTWSVTAEPAGANAPTFSVNGTNAAQNTTATFYEAGNYTFLATITDNDNVSTTSSVNVTVNQTLTSITVSPENPTINVGSTEQFSATGYDQFGNALTTQPTFTWSVPSGGGTINSTGLYTAPSSSGMASVQAASGSVQGSTTVTVGSAPTLVSVVSYKQQGDGSYGITLGMGDTPTVEDRIDGPTDMVLTFNTSVVLGSNFSLTLSSGAGYVVASDETVTLTMTTYATNGQTLVVGLNDVADANTGLSGDYSFDVGVLFGNASGSGTVNAGDLDNVVRNLGAVVNATNFMYDIGCFGTINAADLDDMVRSLGSTLALPPPSGGPLQGSVVESSDSTTSSGPTDSNGLIQTAGSTDTNTADTGGATGGNAAGDTKGNTHNIPKHTKVLVNTGGNNLNNTPLDMPPDTASGDPTLLGKNLFANWFERLK